jgi:hypothetical protein
MKPVSDELISRRLATAGLLPPGPLMAGPAVRAAPNPRLPGASGRAPAVAPRPPGGVVALTPASLVALVILVAGVAAAVAVVMTRGM